MRHMWRWFGPNDLVSVEAMLQAGVKGVVSALHEIPNGEVWPPDAIAERQKLIRTQSDGTVSGLEWDVVESLPVSEAIKKQDADWRRHIENYKTSLTNLAGAGIEVVCYNFMPILDWTRTDLRWKLAHGGTCMRFDYVDFALFDVFLLKRDGAREDYDEHTLALAQSRLTEVDDEFKQSLVSAIVCGLPGANQKLTLENVRELLAEYRAIDAQRLRQHHHTFLQEVAPVAQSVGVRLCCHPDDPPFPLLGLPRVVSTESDYQQMIDAVDLPNNGITLCSGSLGVRFDNDIPGMMSRLGDRVHFLHLRNVKRQPLENQLERANPSISPAIAGSFYEAEHLAGDTDMVSLINAVVIEEARRLKEGRVDYSIPMRPDHGQDILDDLGRQTQPGYPAIGRLKGLAELRGVELALKHS